MGKRRTPPTLSRSRKSVSSPRIKITIYSEGKNTEPQYIKSAAGRFGNRLVVLNIFPAAGSPKTLFEKAISDKKSRPRARKNSFEENDQIWVIFDRDEHDHVDHILSTAKASGVEVAFSNPCFEAWGIVHFRDLDAPIHRHAAQKLMKELMPNYDPDGAKSMDVEWMLDRFGEAKTRAERMRQRRLEEGAVFGCPYTDVDRLVDLIQANGKP